MFTGIITDIGTIESLEKSSDWRARIRTTQALVDVALGASIACNGVCLTVIEKTDYSFDVQLSAETVSRTTAKHWQVGTRINLERALKMGDELGGHIVSGHVDGVGVLRAIIPSQASQIWRISAPAELMPLIAQKGSITVEGVSLTVNDVTDEDFALTLIPHTLAHTTFGGMAVGTLLNLEIDMLARYIQRMLSMKR